MSAIARAPSAVTSKRRRVAPSPPDRLERSAYTLLSQKKVLAADVFTTDPQLLSSKYVQLRDPKNMFGFQHVAPVVSTKLVTENGSRLTSTLNAVNRLLTVKAIAAMNRAVGINKKPADKVADAFLKANGLK